MNKPKPENCLFYLQDRYNLCFDIRMKIKEIIVNETLCKKQIKNTTDHNKELIKQINYYIWLNKTINKKKNKNYTLLNTITYYDS